MVSMVPVESACPVLVFKLALHFPFFPPVCPLFFSGCDQEVYSRLQGGLSQVPTAVLTTC